jgi:hypothetical protein
MVAWSTFAVVIGGASAALLGLLFVAISIRINVVGRSPELRNRAAQTLVLFGAVLIVAILLAIPGQSLLGLGIELIVLGVGIGVGLHLLERRTRQPQSQDIPQTISRTLSTITPNSIASALLLISGVIVAIGWSDGLYVLVAPVLAALIGGLASAWLFLTRLQD